MNSKNFKILVVDDEESHAEAIRRSFELSDINYEINSERTIKEYHDYISKNLTDLVIADLNLPDGSAMEILTFPPENGKFPILIMTSYGDEHIAVEAIKAGALDYIVKSRDAFTSMPHTVTHVIHEWNILLEQKRSQETIKENEASYHTLADSGQALIWTSDTGRLCNYFNKPWLEFTGRKLEDELGNGWVKGVHPDDLKQCIDIYTAAFDKRESFSMVYRLRRHDGDYRWILDDGKPKYNSKGEFIGYIGQCLDITERKKAEEKIEKLNLELEERVAERTKELEAANKELDAFSYSVSHDLKAPLRAVLGFSELVLNENKNSLNKETVNYLEKIKNASEKMASLIDDLLNLSHVNQSTVNKINFDIAEMLRSIIQNFVKQFPERKIKISCIKNASVNADPTLIKIALDNLIENAWKYTSKKQNTEIEFGIEMENGKKVFFIKDNGAGFDMNYFDKLFIPFQRLHSAEEFPGTGIGLAIVKRIISKHNGEVWAESKKGDGAVFYFTLPY